ATLESAHVAALFGGATVGKMLGKFSEILAILDALQQVISLLSQRRYFRFRFPLGAYEDLPYRYLLGTREVTFVFVVILLHLRMVQDDSRAHFAPDHFLLDQLVSDIVFEILERDPAFINLRLEIPHRGNIVLDANVVQTFDHIRLDVDAYIFAVLNEKGIVNEIAQHIFVFRRHLFINLFRRAFGTILLRFLLHLGSRVLQVTAGDHLVIDARNHLFHHHALGLRHA